MRDRSPTQTAGVCVCVCDDACVRVRAAEPELLERAREVVDRQADREAQVKEAKHYEENGQLADALQLYRKATEGLDFSQVSTPC